jgi:hypothetical protein
VITEYASRRITLGLSFREHQYHRTLLIYLVAFRELNYDAKANFTRVGNYWQDNPSIRSTNALLYASSSDEVADPRATLISIV